MQSQPASGGSVLHGFLPSVKRFEDSLSVSGRNSFAVVFDENNQLPEHISTVERFEMWLEDYTNAKILRDSKLTMIENIKAHPKWKEGFAYVTMPLIWPHAEFIKAYNNYRKRFNLG